MVATSKSDCGQEESPPHHTHVTKFTCVSVCMIMNVKQHKEWQIYPYFLKVFLTFYVLCDHMTRRFAQNEDL